jgi:hypothetical protein
MPTNANSVRIGLVKDGLLLAFSILLAVFIMKTDVVHMAISYLHELEYIGSFLAGALFTSVFTTPPSIIILGKLAQENSPWIVALFGGLGAMCGDFILFRFVRDRVSKDLEYLFKLPRAKRVVSIFNTILPRVLWPFLGALIIASPFPDEIGIMLMGLSKIDQRLFLPLSFMLNAIGILLIGFAANTLR